MITSPLKSAVEEKKDQLFDLRNQYLQKKNITARYLGTANVFILLMKHYFSLKHSANITALIQRRKKMFKLLEVW